MGCLFLVLKIHYSAGNFFPPPSFPFSVMLNLLHFFSLFTLFLGVLLGFALLVVTTGFSCQVRRWMNAPFPFFSIFRVMFLSTFIWANYLSAPSHMRFHFSRCGTFRGTAGPGGSPVFLLPNLTRFAFSEWYFFWLGDVLRTFNTSWAGLVSSLPTPRFVFSLVCFFFFFF